MTFIDALLLGLVQGLAEFLPISSSAHLKLAKFFLGIPDGEHLLYFDLVCHGGTLLALMFFLRKEILETLKTPRQIALFTVALAPLVPAYLLLKPLRIAASEPQYLGYCLIATSLLLFAAGRARLRATVPSVAENQMTPSKEWRDVLCIGIMQTMALIPGISRSGSTIAAARFCGWRWIDAARFSFLLAAPTILGGEIIETTRLFRGSSEALGSVDSAYYAAAFFSAFAFGLIGIRFAFRLYESAKIAPLAWYCLFIGLAALRLFHA